jgi:hemerythrin-like domain-containing protein
LFAEHARQRWFCTALLEIAQLGELARDEADAMITFLLRDRAMHHADEDVDLFPALRRRSRREDNMRPLLARLAEDHRRSDDIVRKLTAVLTEHADRDPMPIRRKAKQFMQAYAAGGLRHLALESGVVLVIAKHRLTAKDLRSISLGMRARRGIGP